MTRALEECDTGGGVQPKTNVYDKYQSTVSTAVCFRATVTTHLEVTLFRRLVATPTHSAVLVFLQHMLRLGFSRTLFARQEFLAGGARGAVVAKQWGSR